jgi:glycosyltransferase involved in cell wall biosynthesis
MHNFHEKKILLLASYTIPYTAGGGINAFNFGKFLLEKGIYCQVLTFSRNLRLPLKTSSDQLNIYRIPYFNKGIILKVLSLIFILPYYFYCISKTNILIIYGGNIIAWEFAILFGKLLNKKIVFRSTMFNEDDPISLTKNKIQRLLRKPLLKKIDLYFSLHPEFTKSYKSLSPNNNNILETAQGVNTNIFKPLKNESDKNALRSKLGLPADNYIILSVGLLVKRKGYPEIFNDLLKLDISFKYIILGEYHLEKNHHLYNKHKEINEIYEKGKQILKDKVLFVGYQPNIIEYYQAANVFLMNSCQEGIPNSLLEAMACGLPIVCNKMAGLEDYLTFNNNNCLLFTEVNEIPPLIKKLYSNHKLSAGLSQNASDIISKNFSFEKVYENLKKCLNF